MSCLQLSCPPGRPGWARGSLHSQASGGEQAGPGAVGAAHSPGWNCPAPLLSLLLEKLRAGKALGFISALSLLRSLELLLQAELATGMCLQCVTRTDPPWAWCLFPSHPHLHPGDSPWTRSHHFCCRSHSLSYQVVFHFYHFATTAQLVFLRRTFWKISLLISKICGVCCSEKNLPLH